jgi:pimeloyl-ACP methyl ester carboxylesterase
LTTLSRQRAARGADAGSGKISSSPIPAPSKTARALLPAYFADFRGRAGEFSEFARAVSGSYISGLDDDGVPDPIDDRALLGSVTVDTLVVVGRHDFLCGPRWAAELHERVPGARLAVLEHRGHFGHLEQPAEFARAVADFVRGTA